MYGQSYEIASMMRETFQESFTQSLKKQQAILHERAVALASEDEPEKMEEELELLLFSLGFESYGIETNYVDEVFALHDFTWVPGVPLSLLASPMFVEQC